MMPRTVADWLLHIQRATDLAIAEEAVADIIPHFSSSEWAFQWDRESVQNILNLLTAVRLDQMAKENS